MRLNRNIILSIVFAVLALYVYFFETGPKEKPSISEKAHKIMDFQLENAQEITLKTETEKIYFKKRGNQWQIISPVQSEARNDRVESLLSVFNYPVIRVISHHPSDLSEFGLDNPKIELGLKLKNQTDFHTLQIGSNAPRGLSSYARLAEKPEVFLVGLLYKHQLNRKLDTFMK